MTDSEPDQIVALYETGAPPEVIAQGMGMSVEAVMARLFERSGKYRLALKRTKLDRTKPPEERMLDILIELAESSENEFIVMSAAKFVRDDLKGRRDAIALDAGVNAEALAFLKTNMARLDENRKKFLAERPVIEIPANATT